MPLLFQRPVIVDNPHVDGRMMITPVMPHRPTRHLYLPSPDRSFWQAPSRSHLPLLYLAWGRRDFFHQAIPPSKHDGWVGVLVLEGSPTVLLHGRPRRLAPDHAVLVREDCPLGWRQDTRRECRLLVWMWRHPLHGEMASLPADFSATAKIPAAVRGEFDRLHKACREEVRAMDRLTPAWLEGVQRQIEVLLLRYMGEARPAAAREQVVRDALAWMREHVDSSEPIARLCDYLGLSQPSLNRVFRAVAGKSALEHFRSLRMDHGRTLLRGGDRTVKEVAAALGYRHFNDFSRAYRAHFGRSPSHEANVNSPAN